MAEGRMLKKEIANSKKLGSCHSDRPRVLYFMILPHLDVQGRLLADPKIIKGQITTMLPYSVGSIQVALEELHRVGLIVLYHTGNDQCLEYTRFGDFQSLNPEREAESKILPPTQENSSELKRTPLKLSKDKLSKVKDKTSKYSADFLIFWNKYPTRWIPESDKHVKIGKHLAWEQWQKIHSDVTLRHILDIISQMKSGKAVPDAWRWLRDKKFEDYTAKPPKPDAKTIAEQEERRKQKERDEKGKYYRSKTTKELKEMLLSYGCALDRWLITEILAEREGKK